ncbi:hypothetical protein ABBQ32_012811 [Trebouxia sp. C0010 RCD-2024]
MSSEKQDPAETAARGPRPHRCNARVEDVLQALFTLEFRAKVRPAWKNMRECFKSEPGHEPNQAYLCVTDPDRYLNPERMTYKR